MKWATAADERELLFENVDTSGECWVCTDELSSWGYGQKKIKGRSPQAHRASYEIHFGSIPKGMDVCHHCDNRPCIRPSHLFVGTRKQNMEDCVRKGRIARGERHGVAKLTSTDVLDIRRRIKRGDPRKQIAEDFNVTQSNLCKIHYGVSWGWLKEEAAS